MDDKRLYLRPNVMLEPLVDRWYAWAHLISPATGAMNICGRHAKIMESYIKAPHVHAAAVSNPAMLGGPFIDYAGERVDEIEALLRRTLSERSLMVELDQAFRDLDDTLRNEATGQSLDPLYDKVPELLRGFVELVYDLNSNPSFRLIEPLLYNRFYDPSTESIVLSTITGDDRPFILSTPRLDSEKDLHLPLPFASASIDELFRAKQSPLPFDHIKHALDVPDRMDAQLLDLLTDKSPAPYCPYSGQGARWRYFGHACILVETESTRILLDPVLSYTYESDISRLTYEDLPDEIDYVLITHNHQDHISIETLLQIRHKTKHIVVPRNGSGAVQDPSLRLVLEHIGFDNVIELDEMQEIRTDTGRIVGLPFFGEHGDLNIRTKMAWWVEVDGHRLLFAADSCNVAPEAYHRVQEVVGDAEVLFLGMECDGAPVTWIYGPLFTKIPDRKQDLSRRLAGSNYERGIEIVSAFNCKEVYVYAMGQEPWLNYITSKKYTDESRPIVDSNRLVEACRAKGMVSERLFGEKEILLT
jgi:L-ascorbate metabolism protein UlaG (beta-lactamase superfamily)